MIMTIGETKITYIKKEMEKEEGTPTLDLYVKTNPSTNN